MDLSNQAKKTRRLVKEYRAAMANITTGWCSDLETRHVYSVKMLHGEAARHMKSTQARYKLKQAS